MIRDDIFSVPFLANDKARSLLNMKRLSDCFTGTRLFDKAAAAIAATAPINSKILNKIKMNQEYLSTWQNACSLIFAYLVGPAKFFERNDADELVCLPIVTKIQIGNSLQSIRAMNIYNSTKWIGTFFYRDPEFNNEFGFFGQNGFVSTGAWASKVRADVQGYNIYGLTKTGVVTPTTNIARSTIIESTESVSNTITVHDIFSKIDELKKTYNVGLT